MFLNALLIAIDVNNFFNALPYMGLGMLGVFLTAILPKRGNTKSVIAALISGILIVIPLMFQKEFFGANYIAWTWWCPIGGLITTAICLLGKPKKA